MYICKHIMNKWKNRDGSRICDYTYYAYRYISHQAGTCILCWNGNKFGHFTVKHFELSFPMYQLITE
jgi:hypothetical protein